ncbi:YncE family protein [Opitutus terrae]|uniref:Uncharacterized protein n=1 Tax=Opitutus terrae (strain DSM 11246 / JCM 15787 / PB90-1) TaxID=452637 RepID=B1ZU90_OPITP|nr:hypothetical protein [Opitutus terrae]ACB76652.1 hypothetical protein Oter_3375 [Opitutus terrae PB90-1]
MKILTQLVSCLAVLATALPASVRAGDSDARETDLQHSDAPGTGYSAAQLSWTKSAVDARLGPSFEQLNPGVPDTRPTVPKRPSKIPPDKFYVRIRPYELGDHPEPDGDYWSDSGNVAYIPDDPADDPGLDRIQTYAYYSKVFAISPRLDHASGRPHPEPQTRDAHYVALNGGPLQQPVAMVRNYAMEQNEAIVIYRDGLFAVAGTQTSRGPKERPYPGFKFPPNKVPRAVAVTTSNEFALVTVWDTDRHVGQLAVVALEGKYLPFHTWPYMALPNQGSFSDFKLLGYVDLPMAAPDSVAAASNGLWTGPSATGGRVLSQIDLSDDRSRALVYEGAWQSVVARSGYAIVASKDDDKVVILDLTPLFSYARESWLSSNSNFQETLAARGSEPTQFPQTFDVRPGIKPEIVWYSTMKSPTAVLAGQRVGHHSTDRFKAYVATEDGTVHIIDTSSLMVRSSRQVRGRLREIGTVRVGRNPTSMAFARHTARNLPLLPPPRKGGRDSSDPLNNLFYVACRGDRTIDAVVTLHGKGVVYERVQDSRIGDPVAVGVARRGNILLVADFAGKKVLSFLMGPVKDRRNNQLYTPIDPNFSYEFAGELHLNGSPFLVNSTNVN